MRNEKNFTNEINYGNAALEANFKCNCGNEIFKIFHSGTAQKGLFGGFTIKKKDKQLAIKCVCPNCSKEFTLFDSTKDGSKTTDSPLCDFQQLEIRGENQFNIKIRYNFYEENYKTDRFEMFFLDVKPQGFDKYIRIVEE